MAWDAKPAYLRKHPRFVRRWAIIYLSIKQSSWLIIFCWLRHLTDANYKSLFCLFSVQYYKYLWGTYNRQKKLWPFWLAAWWPYGGKFHYKEFSSFIALAFIHCTGVNIIIKKPSLSVQEIIHYIYKVYLVRIPEALLGVLVIRDSWQNNLRDKG